MTVQFVDDRSDPGLLVEVKIDQLEELAAATLAAEQVPAAEVSVTLVDEPEMASLNAAHMNKAGPTDVLSFPLESLTPGTPPEMPDGPPLLIGDVFICPSVVASNADGAGVAFEHEMALMVVHGLLHLLGYDHIVDSEAEQMEQRERDLLGVVGLVRP